MPGVLLGTVHLHLSCPFVLALRFGSWAFAGHVYLLKLGPCRHTGGRHIPGRQSRHSTKHRGGGRETMAYRAAGIGVPVGSTAYVCMYMDREQVVGR
ncbi:hypothetical protein F4780DRAFT_266234 [Xylariomycetidae sp. FL0641]|nr:hypothetical protein F4780DRAFT_266234 [Xylariomycetidae sp. FL0641]